MLATDLCLAEARLRAVSLSEVVSAAPSLSSLKGMLYTPELSNRFMVCKCLVWLVVWCVRCRGWTERDWDHATDGQDSSPRSHCPPPPQGRTAHCRPAHRTLHWPEY